ncbi:AAA domain-containing protein [Bacillus sp. JJ864]|uniref:AAA domain-containing protein n=1 Tax=Bacillus sp. JJ864 TaxID=3122975 RepID=UPI002FFD7D10
MGERNEFYNGKRLIKYFRDSIADSEKSEIDQTKLREDYIVPLKDIEKGKIDVNFVKWLCKKKYKKLPDGIKEEDIALDVLLCPLQFNVNSMHAQEVTSFPSSVALFIIPAKLTCKGELRINENKAPWIPRSYLAPSLTITIGELNAMDAFLSKSKLPDAGSEWDLYWKYCNQMFHQVTGYSIHDFELQYYTSSDKSYVILDEEVVGTRQHINKLYDFLLTDKYAHINKLLGNYCSLSRAKKLTVRSGMDAIDDSAHHYGQVGNEFPLSNSQRESLHHFNLCEEGDILAVNGPPGTGKTTLLHSIIAQVVVEAAARKDENPPVIVAASNNNQAVTNIIDSLGKVCDSKHTLAKRWLPDIGSYGMYIASEQKIKKIEDGKYHTLTSNNNGLPQLMENKEYVHRAVEYFISHYAQNFQLPLQQVHVQDCATVIHKRLQERLYSIKETTGVVKRYEEIKNYIKKQYGSFDKLDEYIHNLTVEIAEVKKTISDMAFLDERFIKFRKTLKWYLRSLEFIPYFGRKSNLENELFLRKNEVTFKISNFNTMSIRESILAHIRQIDSILKIKEEALSKAHKDKGISEERINLVLDCSRTLGIQTDRKTFQSEKILEELDKTYRFEAFHLAIHYYEAKWIEETSKDLDEGYTDKKSVQKQMRKWKRYAKITPCFVSTFFMVPKFFSAWQGKDEYLFNFIDLLIVDEAGQVPPEIAGAAFALAKKAVVVGDTLQIEPVWGLTEMVDRENMKEAIRATKMIPEEFIDYGMSVSSGNVMRIAQQLCKYDKFQNIGGMYLTEHRRCVPEIIEYCNELAYEGKLEAKRENQLNDKKTFPFPYMGHIHVEGQAERVNMSWKNELEAQQIADWIIGNIDQIQHYYGKSGKPFLISDYVAIVTPFTVQAVVIRQSLKAKGLEGITVGTVHKLQGAERRIVLFSSVYTSKHRGGYFFDRKVNMLNVAVSRAQDSFIIFGDKNILDKKQRGRPSGLLAQYVLN